jgi:hypothetical protein
MIIAIDYDFTFTNDVELFSRFIAVAQLRGHTVICVTGRTEPPDLTREVQFPPGVKTICAGAMEKRKAAENAGYKVDIWIDDMPETIGQCVQLQLDN